MANLVVLESLSKGRARLAVFATHVDLLLHLVKDRVAKLPEEVRR